MDFDGTNTTGPGLSTFDLDFPVSQQGVSGPLLSCRQFGTGLLLAIRTFQSHSVP